MSEATTLKDATSVAPAQPLACRLRRTPVSGRRGLVADMGEVELQNLSARAVDIPYWMTALQYLHLVVTRSDGAVLSEGHFGDRFAPTLEPLVLHLEPGDKFTAIVPLFATVAHPPLPPGTYLVQAVYEYNGFRAVSDPLPVAV
jgi:hypothetical protein